MSVRYHPFGEWVIVYFDPEKTSEDALLKKIRNNGCPKAALVRGKKESIALTPIITPGDTALIQIQLEQDTSLTAIDLPEGWLISSELNNLEEGTHLLSIRTPSRTAKKKRTITLKDDDGEDYEFHIELVSRVD